MYFFPTNSYFVNTQCVYVHELYEFLHSFDVLISFLGAVAKFRKETISFIMLKFDVWDFSKICQGNLIFIKIRQK
jgi:hypothetical protein